MKDFYSHNFPQFDNDAALKSTTNTSALNSTAVNVGSNEGEFHAAIAI